MDLLKYLHTFSRVAERGSFSSAARELGVAQPVASRQIALLEGFYGFRLINRTTRSLALTQEGRALLLHIKPALDAIDTARDSLRTMGSSVSGVVRIGAPVALGLLFGARVKPLLDRNPQLSIELSVGEDVGSMVKEGLDLFVTADNPPNTSLIARRIGESRRVLVASSRYLDQAGTPERVQDLTDHSCVICPVAGDASTWRFDGPQGPQTVPISGQLRCSSAELVRRAVLQGVGIGLLPEFHVAADIEGGDLHRLLTAYSTAPASMHILYPSRRDLPARTRAVISFLLQDWQGLVASRPPLALLESHPAPERCCLPANIDIRVDRPRTAEHAPHAPAIREWRQGGRRRV